MHLHNATTTIFKCNDVQHSISAYIKWVFRGSWLRKLLRKLVMTYISSYLNWSFVYTERRILNVWTLYSVLGSNIEMVLDGTETALCEIVPTQLNILKSILFKLGCNHSNVVQSHSAGFAASSNKSGVPVKTSLKRRSYLCYGRICF